MAEIFTLAPIGTYSKMTSRPAAEPGSLPCPDRSSGGTLDLAPRPDLVERPYKIAHHLIRMHRTRREAQPLRAARHGRIVDGLHIETVILQQLIADLLADHRIAHHDRHDMALAPEHGQARIRHHLTQRRRALLMPLPLRRAFLQMTDSRKHPRHQHR